jgi:hypothetical protein
LSAVPSFAGKPKVLQADGRELKRRPRQFPYDLFGEIGKDKVRPSTFGGKERLIAPALINKPGKFSGGMKADRVSSMRLGFNLVFVPRRLSSVTSAKTASSNNAGADSSPAEGQETSIRTSS